MEDAIERNVPVDEINVVQNENKEESVEQRVNIMALRHMTSTWVVMND